jgi:hypothetical protein
MNIMSVLTHSLVSIMTNIFTSWVIIPLLLMVDSYGHIAGSLRAVKASKAKSKRN